MKLVVSSSSCLFAAVVVVALCAHLVGAFVPQQKLIDLQGSFEAIIQRAQEDTRSLRSSRAEPISTADTTTTTTTSRARKGLAVVSSTTNNNKVSTTLAASTATPVVANKRAVVHKRWGIDNTNEDEYWYDSRIHTLGNCGFMGAVSDLSCC